MTLEERKENFIKKATEIHKGKYNYSFVEYLGNRFKIKIICHTHGEFEQLAANHVTGSSCPKCNIEGLKSNYNDLIIDFNKTHNNKYDYSLIKYINNRTKVNIICPTHGIFKQAPHKHKRGQGCPKCKVNCIRYDQNEIIQHFKEIHGDKYDYSIVDFTKKKSNVSIICKVHGIFKQSPKMHINGQECPKCRGGIRYSLVEFIEKSSKIHKNKFDYSLVEYINTSTPVKIICKKHGIFEQSPNCHISQKQGCPTCRESKGEKEIYNWLLSNNILFERQKKFPTLKHKRHLKIDFFLEKLNICIEYDGPQHSKSSEFYGGKKSYEESKIRDEIKNKWCFDNTIKLIRIPYTEYKNIEEILKKEILV